MASGVTDPAPLRGDPEQLLGNRDTEELGVAQPMVCDRRR